jgi:hypothetical protein
MENQPREALRNYKWSQNGPFKGAYFHFSSCVSCFAFNSMWSSGWFLQQHLPDSWVTGTASRGGCLCQQHRCSRWSYSLAFPWLLCQGMLLLSILIDLVVYIYTSLRSPPTYRILRLTYISYISFNFSTYHRWILIIVSNIFKVYVFN